MANSIIAFGSGGAGVWCDGVEEPYLSCCDVYGNAGGDWVGCIAAQADSGGNISLDPLFCGRGEKDFTIWYESPCVPFSPAHPECDLVGAWPVGCGPGACCIGSFCVISEEGPCWQGGGTYQGYSIPCQPDPCLTSNGPPPRGADVLPELVASPNPSAGTTMITFRAPEGRRARLEIFAPSGRLVRRLMDAPITGEGRHLDWDGRDDSGNRVSSGVYMIRLTCGGVELRRSIVRLSN
jgi:hypothetical protein